MPRFFNTTGPWDPVDHYCLPAIARLPDVTPLIERKQYFVLHAPRQTGKTTAMRALAAALRATGLVACWATLERCQGIEDLERAEPLWLQSLHDWSRRGLPEAFRAPDPGPFLAGSVGGRLNAYLAAWAAALDVPLILLLDEADVVAGPAMISLLRQLRDGFMDRGVGRFPTSVALIGMRDLRDHLVDSKDGRTLNPGSPFNIKAASLTLRNFDHDEVATLLALHTEETGQPFTPEAVDEIARITDGQPFLVNALADLCVTSLVPGRAQPITRAHADAARERLILARATHLDSLAERLKEPRVARIIQAVVVGDDPRSIVYDSDDFQYVVDLGLIRCNPPSRARGGRGPPPTAASTSPRSSPPSASGGARTPTPSPPSPPPGPRPCPTSPSARSCSAS